MPRKRGRPKKSVAPALKDGHEGDNLMSEVSPNVVGEGRSFIRPLVQHDGQTDSMSTTVPVSVVKSKRNGNSARAGNSSPKVKSPRKKKAVGESKASTKRSVAVPKTRSSVKGAKVVPSPVSSSVSSTTKGKMRAVNDATIVPDEDVVDNLDESLTDSANASN